MGIFQNNLMGAAAAAASAGGGGFYDHQIDQSFRWDSGYLKRTPGSAGNRQTWTFSCWVKKAIQPGDTDVMLLNAGTSGNQSSRFRAYWYSDNLRSSSADANYNVSSGVYRDSSAWQHIVWKLTGGTSTQYVNGTSVSTSSVSGDVAINNNVEHTLGIAGGYETATRFKGYLAEVVFIDGTALDPTSFASEKNGVWIPDDVSGLTFGSQGYHLDFASASDPGNDVSGNNNDWTNVSLATHDQMLDSPTFGSEGSANFPTINPLDPTIPLAAISNGNLQITEVANNRGAKANFAIPLTGKWYWEQYVYADSAQELWGGITGITTNSSAEGRGGSSNSNTYGASWSNYSGSNMYIRKFIAGSESAESGSFGSTKDTILGIAINRDDNEAKFYKNNALQFTTAISATQEYFPAGGLGGGTNATTINIFNFGQDGTFAGNETAQGNADGNGYGNFYYSPPTDFLALNSANLPIAEEIDPAQTDDDFPKKLFSPLIYTGNGSNRSITGLGFKPDWLWFKARTNTERWTVYDSTRGTGKYLTLNTDGDQGTDSSTLSAFGSDGFSLGTNAFINGSSTPFASFSWRANGGTTATNTAGDMDTTVQVDPSGHFSIVKYVGNGSVGQTWGHGLSVKPDFIVLKKTSGNEDWVVYHSDLGATKYLSLNNSSAVTTGNEIWYGTEPTSTIVYVDNNGRANYPSGQTYIAYCFANSEGFIKADSYVGNASNDGTFIYTGFKPAFVMNKPIVAGNWRVVDNKRSPINVTQNSLTPNSTAAQDTYDSTNIDFLSNGFKIRNYDTPMNQATTYVYLAFAENPFKYATAR